MPTAVQRVIRLHRAQREFRRGTALYRGFVGGRGAGKTWVGAYDLLRRAKRGRTYLVGSPTSVLMQDTTFPTFKALALSLGVWDPAGVRLTPYPTVRLRTGTTVRFRTAEDPEKMRGPNLSGVWLDEASLMARDVYTVCIASLREQGEQGWLSATFTPKGLAHWTYEVFARGGPDVALYHAPTRANPFLPPAFQETLARQYSGGVARQELDGLFVDFDDAWQVIPTAWVQVAQARWTATPPANARLDAVGVDVARGGADQTVLAKRYGMWFSPLEKHAGRATPDGPTAAALVVQALRENPRALACVDVIGVGASVFDCLAGKVNALAVNFAAGTPATDSTGQLTFANLRAYAYWSLRELLDPARGAFGHVPEKERLALPPDPELLADLTAPKWAMTVSGVRIEPKEKIQKRLGRSPDCGDAVACAVLLPGPALGNVGGPDVLRA